MIDHMLTVLTSLNKMSAVEISNFLYSNGYSVKKGDDYFCPLVKYLRQACQDNTISISDSIYSSYGFYDGESYINNYKYYIPLSVSINAFIEAFDAGHFPDLVEEELDMIKATQLGRRVHAPTF